MIPKLVTLNTHKYKTTLNKVQDNRVILRSWTEGTYIVINQADY